MNITDEYLTMQDSKHYRRMKGYSKFSRSRYLLFINDDLTETEFILHSYIWDVMTDWDSRHLKYATFEFIPDIVSHQINWSSSKVRRVFKTLQSKKYIAHLGNYDYAVVGYSLIEKITNKSEEFDFYIELKKVISQYKEDVENNKN